LNKNVANLPYTESLGLLDGDNVTWNNNMDQLIPKLNSACYAIRDVNAMFSRKG
jgi:hypothetical protein